MKRSNWSLGYLVNLFVSWAIISGTTGYIPAAAYAGGVSQGEVQHRSDSLLPLTTPKRFGEDLFALGLQKCVEVWLLPDDHLIAACTESSRDTKKDYGIRLYILSKETGSYIIKQRFSGARDAYSAHISFFSHAGKSVPELIAVDYSAELSYGVLLYQYKAGVLKRIGAIDLGFDDGNGGVASVVPVMKIVSTAQGFVVGFESDVVKMLKNGTYVSIPKNRIRYVYDGHKLKEKRN